LYLQQRNSGLTDYQKVESIVLLMAAGGDCYQDMAVLLADEGLQRLLGYRLPSPDSVRAFVNAFHDERVIEQAMAARPRGTVAYIPEDSEPLVALASINVALCHAVAAQGKSVCATLDHDATIQESHKKQAMPHYKGGVGYQPVAVYWAEQDLVIADEYRDGNVPAGMNRSGRSEAESAEVHEHGEAARSEQLAPDPAQFPIAALVDDQAVLSRRQRVL